jgi:glycosyltransferase involved in cell wall biosynthesis
MKLLVLAQTPPPLHGQSFMVQTLLAGLPALGIEVRHVPLRLSRDAADIGRWRPGKAFAALRAGLTARRLARREPCDALYYVPAPGKRGALWRDLLVLGLARPACPRLVLHWHASGLGEWLRTHATAAERALARRALGHADLALVLGEALRADALELSPRRVAVVPNGIADPCPDFVRPPPTAGAPFAAVYLGLCCEEKGLFDAIAGVAEANRRATAAGQPARFHLTVAGDFADPRERQRFAAQTAALGDTVRYAGFVTGEAKHALLARADALLFPSRYAHETQGLVVLEALAHDLPPIVSRWRAVPESLPVDYPHVVRPGQPAEIADHLLAIAHQPPAPGSLRRHFLAHFTANQHLAAVVTSLRSIAD